MNSHERCKHKSPDPADSNGKFLVKFEINYRFFICKIMSFVSPKKDSGSGEIINISRVNKAKKFKSDIIYLYHF